MEKILDANIIIRYLVEDDNQKAGAIEKLFRSNEALVVTDVTISEIIWVLLSYYKQKKQNIIRQLTSFIQLTNIKCNKTILIRALEYYKNLNIDWVDAYLSSYAIENKITGVYSYDKGLSKIPEINRLEP